jgi:hypothetical protein
MTRQPIISRRLLLAGLWLAVSPSAWAQVRRASDQGIGGTGIGRGNDHGIGGTGIVGVIRRFGSIFVNGERIGYAPNVPVQIDGKQASAKALRIGHLARVLALPQANGSLVTRRIDVVSEVVGPIEAIRAGEMTVLGQRVVWEGRESWRRPGTNVAVFGLRRTDGVIVASLVEPRGAAAMRVSGLLERDRDGLRVGGLRLDGIDAAFVGQRVQAEGRTGNGVMQVSHAKLDDLSDLAGANRLSIEAYVRRVDGDLQFGSGYVARGASRFQPSGDSRVVVNAVFDGARGLRVESIQADTRSPGSSVLGPAGPERMPGTMPGPDNGSKMPGGNPNIPGSHPEAPGSFSPGGPPNEPGGPGGFGVPGGPSGPPGGPFGPGGGVPGGGRR